MVARRSGRDGERQALSGLRICDFSGQLAGAGATRFLAVMGAEVIRIEDPVTQGYWDALRGVAPFVDERRGPDLGGAFNNHNVEKLGVTLNLRTEAGRRLVRELVAVSDVVTENFAPGVMARLGLAYEDLRAVKEDLIYVSNSGFGQQGPYRSFKTWGPLAQAMCGLTFSTGLAGERPTGIGYSYMDHQGANFMAVAILAGLRHRRRTGRGQWIDVSCTDAGALLLGPALLDWSVNARPARREGAPDSNHSQFPPMAPHAVYPARGEDCWVAIVCRDDDDWARLAALVGEAWAQDPSYRRLEGRLEDQEGLDRQVGSWTSQLDRFELAARLCRAGVPASAVQRPGERIEDDRRNAEWGLWPRVVHPEMGPVRVDGLPVHLSLTDWSVDRPAPCLGQHNERVFGGLLGHSSEELEQLRQDGVL